MQRVAMRWRPVYSEEVARALGKPHGRWKYEERDVPPGPLHKDESIEYEFLYVITPEDDL